MELIAAVRAKRPGMPVILTTGYAELPEGSPADIAKLNKPFLQDDLARAIAAAVEKDADPRVVAFRPKQG